MSDPVELARGARVILADALKALQSAPDAPDALLDIAEPIARCMGILHGIERSGGRDLSGRDEALAGVRSALDALQTVDVNHPAVDEATEAIAGSLSKLFALSRAQSARAVEPAARGAGPRPGPAAEPRPVAAPAGPPAAAPAPALAPTPATAPDLGVAPAPGQVAQPAGAAVEPAPPAAGPSPKATAMAGTPAAVAAVPAAPPGPTQAEADELARQVAEAEARAAEMRRLAEQRAAEAARQAQEAQQRAEAAAARQAQEFKRVPGQTDAPAPPEGAIRVEVELGAHSASNFYKGLSGNDVVDHGGIFVATYKIPKVGTPVALRVLLPGDLEFDADAVVHWVRETRTGESVPGFGARLTRITGEGRQLVYRYARNREPMFHDDL